MYIKKNLFNILFGFVPFSNMRKQLRQNFLKLLNNKIIIIKNGREIIKKSVKGLNIKFMGKNSTIIIHEPVSFKNCTFKIGDNSKVEIYPTKHIISKLNISAKITLRL